MLAKLTSKNQLTLPKAVLAEVGSMDYFDATAENRKNVLTPVRINGIDEVRAKLETLVITEYEVVDAVAWARSRN